MQNSKYLILFFLVSFCRLTFAQDTGNFTQFFFNPYSLNPSFAGIDGRGALFAAYRKQWSGIEGSPTIANLSYHGPVGQRLSLGINVANDKRGLLTNSGALITLGYSIPLGEASFLRFGISGGGSWNTVDLNKMQSQNTGNDPALNNLLNQTASVIGNAGLSLHIKSFHIGAALPNLFTPVFVSEDAFTMTEVKPFEAVVIHASNRFYFADNKHIFEPYAVYRINNGLPSQYEFAGVIHLSHVVWLGGSYKEDFGISGLGGIKVNNKFAVGASYTLKNSGENELNFPSYEIHLSILAGSSKSKSKSKSKDTRALPMYSFVNTEIPKKTRTELMNDNYAAAIAKADKAFATKNYELARLDYYEAQKFKPSENYPKTKIAEIDKLLAYDSKLKMANNEFAAKKYEQALTDYEAASAINPGEQYPKDKIAEIKAMLAPKTVEIDGDKKYRDAITKGDIAMASKNYEEAKVSYNEALKIKPAEVYPKLQITEAQKAISYQSNIRKADSELSTKSYAEALADYRAASQLYPDEQYPKDQISKINALMASTTVEKAPVEAPERHETVKRGVNAQELMPGNYVIVGVFGSGTNARNLTRQIVESGLNANYGFLTEKKLWYVHIFAGTDINATRTERDKYRQQPMFKNAWLLTVED